MRIGFVSCSKSKKGYRCRAEELYSASTLFKFSSQYCRMNYDKWFILSAKYGLVNPSQVLDPYDETLMHFNKPRQLQWAEGVYQQIAHECSSSDMLYFHAGELYIKKLTQLLDIDGFSFYRPLKGLGIGEQLKWYKKELSCGI